jgi:molybdate transport system ATP-binding protein
LTRYITVQLKGVCLERGGRAVLRQINWSVRPGQHWVLLGANGAGKTQLLKLLAGDVWPTPIGSESRQYRWRGETLHHPYGVKEEIAYIGAERQDKYERYGWDHRVEEVIGTGLYRTDIPLDRLTRHDRKRIRALLARFRIERLAKRRFLSLSYGERRIALLARAIAREPKLLLLDELFNGLDDRHRTRILEWLKSTSGRELPWVLATHRAEDVPKSTTHVGVLEKGRMVYKGRLARAPVRRWLEGAAKSPARRIRAQSSGTYFVRLSSASVHLGDARVLRHISFELRAGQCWVVHGPNGSGKSTLLRAIYGEHPLGNIERAGIEPGVPLESFKMKGGWIAPHVQSSHPQHLMVAEVVQSGRYASIGLNDAPTATDRASARRALALFALTQVAQRPLRELSYGEVRRVLFARAWVREPQFLLLDEPFSGLDAPTRSLLLKRVDQAISRGVAVMLATHHASEWPSGATHELALRQGRATYCGPIRAITPGRTASLRKT